jgi:hypothetical protein
MIAQAHLLRSQSSVSYKRVRYEAPCDLLPWADPYIASLFAGGDGETLYGQAAYLDDTEETDSWRGR